MPPLHNCLCTCCVCVVGLPKNEEFSFTVDEETLEKIMRRVGVFSAS